MVRGGKHLLVSLLLLCVAAAVAAQGPGGVKRDQALPSGVSARAGLSVVLGRPSDEGIVLNLYGDHEQIVTLEYGTTLSPPEKAISGIRVPAKTGVEVSLTGLLPDTEYLYRLPGGITGRFNTQRKPGSQFSFEIIGDSHPERPQQFSPAMYVETLEAAAAGKPDFFIMIGDDFSVDTLPAITPEAVRGIYERQRMYLSLIGSVSPIFLVNGNHEQASMANLDGTPNNVAVWSQVARNSLFPQPAPDRFYTGDGKKVEHIGYLRDYYAWEWGDALFIVLDPYWHSPVAVDNETGGRSKAGGSGKSGRDLWQITLGDDQYLWLTSILESRKSEYVFIFTHHVLGTGRGGIELAESYEWGGKNSQGKDEFSRQRPGWPLPIHEVLVKNNVTAVFQGHDHLFARQELDGLTYVTLPEPADPNGMLYNSEAYRSGVKLANSGRIRATVGPDGVLIEYFRQDTVPVYSFSLPSDKGIQP